MNFIYSLDIAVIGGGAAGLTAAISAGRALPDNAKIAVFEALPRCGKKLLATGNGRCNITNRFAQPTSYNSDDSRAVKQVFDEINNQNTLKFFESLGLICREEDDGRIYPSCGQASAVLDLLRLELDRLHIEEVCGCRIEKIKHEANGYIISSSLGIIKAKSVIIACGGMAAPSLGGVDWGYSLMKSLGHSVTKLSPSLAPIPVKSPHLSSLKGIRALAKASIGDERGEIYSDTGEVQFGDKALSGIVMFQLSSAAANRPSKGLCITLDMLPELTENETIEMLTKRRTTLTHLTLENYLTGVFNKRVGMCILKHSGMAPLSRPVSGLSDSDIRKIAHVIKNWDFSAEGTASWNNAQVTCGGVRLSEFDGMTMQSRLSKGLFAAGEMLNTDGKCGGFNLQWAWSSGILAGKSAAKYVSKGKQLL